ncbi:MAG: ribonuclease III domain-containing protein [Prochloraceae cyanobacterium]|nr:ribonuclease III domain-containing protein [Prochloraceae cyanobacterium]
MKQKEQKAWAEIELKAICQGPDEIAKIKQISPASLAYLGDAVYELYVRTYYLLPAQRLANYHDRVVKQVRAEAQAAHLKSLLDRLDDRELEIVRRGRNAANGGRRGLDRNIYQQATSLETLLGYLYINNPNRLRELLERLELDRT